MKQVTGVIRDRWQLTIPNSVRALHGWLQPRAVISINADQPEEIVIRPHRQKARIDWQSIWNSIFLVRTFSGKRGNLSSFIASDRQKHV